MIKEITDKTELEKLKKDNESLIIIFYTDSSGKSKKAYDALKMVKEENPDAPIFGVNATRTRDIHPVYNITTVPTVLFLKNGKISNIVHGVQDKQYYMSLLYDTHISNPAKDDGRKQRRVVVYTSPTCSWCAAVKSYLMKNRIHFREVDIAKDERAGQELIRRSGQMGVPQTDIEGRIVVGFDKAKLDNILGIRSK
jgi:glutaredoxin-like YruB-family protein